MASSRTRKNSRVFVDSSVLIAAAISSTGTARGLIVQGLRGRLDLYLSPDVLEETERNLSAKAPDALGAFRVFRSLLPAKLVSPPKSLILEAARIVANKDAVIVAAASHARADYLATYDRRHLLSRKEEISAHFKVIVATPEEILGAGQVLHVSDT